MRSYGIIAVLLLGLTAGCGDDESVPGDTTTNTGSDDTTSGDGDGDTTTTGPDEPDPICGDAQAEGDEECDDGNSNDEDLCNRDCTLTCGDGRVGTNEACDIAIASGDGVCPTTCDDQDSCTQDTRSGVECDQQCLFAPITTPANDDGCCPDGANANNDNDCAPKCGNGVVEDGELCDTSIEAGQPGACPTSCDDQQTCTTDELANPGTCQAACTNTEITEPADDDGCCPIGGTNNNDNDCSVSCGNGEVEDGELCDTAIEAGQPGACPTECSDADACTRDVLVSGGTCNATCTFPEITSPANDDGCCPANGNANNDNDCAPTCGNDVPEPGEECDDGNDEDGDGCSSQCVSEGTTFRLTSLQLKDPHVFGRVVLCLDITNEVPFSEGLNPRIQGAIEDLELNILSKLTPARSQAPGGEISIVSAECEGDANAPACSIPPDTSITTTDFENQTEGTCLEPIPGTLAAPPNTSPIGSPEANCFRSDAVEELTFEVAGIEVALQDAQIAATYSGSPPSRLVVGLVRGFLTREAAATVLLPDDLKNLLNVERLDQLLRGGGACRSGSDVDISPSGEEGWYFYLNFEAAEVPTPAGLPLRTPNNTLMSLP